MKAYNLQQAREKKEEITELYLHNLQLQEVPSIVFECPNLEILEVSKNRLQEIPKDIIRLNKLRSLSFAHNKLTTIPDELAKLSLQKVDLSHNCLTIFFELICQLSHLEILNLSYNQIEVIPTAIKQLSRLQVLKMANNALRQIPAEIGSLKDLKSVDFRKNKLTRLPAGVKHWQVLEYLDLTSNRIKQLPESIGNWSALSILKIGFNRIQNLPESIASCSSLRKIEANNNRIADLPKAIGQLSWLAYLHLSKNKLSELPESIIGCQQLQILDLSKNAFQIINNSLRQLPHLTTLDLSFNQLQKWPVLPLGLRSLNLKKNLLQKIPSTIKQLNDLESLYLSGNQFSKDTLKVLVHLKYLKLLQGLLPYRETKAFLRFLNQLNQYEISSKERDSLLKLFVDDYEEADQYELSLFFKALNLKLPKFQEKIKAYLVSLNSFETHPLQSGNTLTYLGKTTLPKKLVKQKLAALGIGFSSDITSATSHVLLGKAPIPTASNLKKSIIFLSEQMLKQFLDQFESQHLVMDVNEAKIKNLKRFLLHPQSSNVELAVQLLKGGGVPKSLWTELFIAWKKANSPMLKKELRHLLELHLPKQIRQLMTYPFHLSNVDRKKGLNLAAELGMEVELLVEYLVED